MGYADLEPLSAEEIARIAAKEDYPHYPLKSSRLRYTRQKWRSMCARGIVIPDDARYHITAHPNRLNADPARLTPIYDNAHPMSPGQATQWRSLGLMIDTAGRPLHPHAGQLLTTAGMLTGPGWSWHYGPQIVGNALAYCFVGGEPYYAMVETRRGNGTRWSLAGGHAEPGESPEMAAWRELDEEAGANPWSEGALGGSSRLARLMCSPQDTLHAWLEEWFSRIQLPGRVPLRPRDCKEVIGAAWLDYTAVSRLGRAVFDTHLRMIVDHREGVFA
jgi:8-oxo-dGTP pyrophosphatase MutT (NUDIX family)